MAIDPICGMEVDEQNALHAEWRGETYYFCSEHCRDKFLLQPECTTAQADSTDAASGHACCHASDDESDRTTTAEPPEGAAKYVCPMCEGVESDGPGDCPKCGMALEPAGPKRRTIYTCPMHPEIEQDQPGSCPK